MAKKHPGVWQMVKEAIDNLEGEITYKQVITFINEKWEGVLPVTIIRNIYLLTVNRETRIHYNVNHKPRLSDTGSPYDYLYAPSKATVVKYNMEDHGVWEIYYKDKNLAVREVEENVNKKNYTPLDIIWIKNVNAEDGAYLDENNTFPLHFPDTHETNASSPAVGEIIVLYQKINEIRYFTHLVTPVDTKIGYDPGNSKYPHTREVSIIARTDRNSLIPVDSTQWIHVSFRGIIHGNACQIDNIESIRNPDAIKLEIWEMFIPYFREKESVENIAAIKTEIKNDPDLRVSEGSQQLLLHFVRERNRKIVQEKKREALENKKLYCEVCTFSFQKVFGKDFIECHHLDPINGGERLTSKEHLALVCSNCHRMLHIKFENRYLSIEELKDRKEKP